jgi:hypothetical protein
MPSRKKSKSKRTGTKTTTAKRAKKVLRASKPKHSKSVVKKKQSKKKATSKATPVQKRGTQVRRAQLLESPWPKKGAIADRQSGDLEGLSRAEQADSESVDELVEEGNIFEAGAVAGVEQADKEDTREVQTHEVPEDDVPEEYLDKD